MSFSALQSFEARLKSCPARCWIAVGDRIGRAELAQTTLECRLFRGAGARSPWLYAWCLLVNQVVHRRICREKTPRFRFRWSHVGPGVICWFYETRTFIERICINETSLTGGGARNGLFSVLIVPYMFNCRTKLEKFRCLKCSGSTSWANRVALQTRKEFPDAFHEIRGWFLRSDTILLYKRAKD